jgi:hypothetical protein
LAWVDRVNDRRDGIIEGHGGRWVEVRRRRGAVG